MTLLVADRLTKRFQAADSALTVLQDLSLQVEAGEMVAVVGPSGSGKSTLLHLLGGLERPTSGSVLLSGQDYGALSEEELTVLRRRQIGYVFQSLNLVPGMTALENVALPAWLDGRRPSQQALESALEAVGLAHRKQHRALLLSGGEQQRVAIARALFHQPKLILADEPTASLDSATGASIVSLLRKAAEAGQAVVMVTHDDQAASWADRIIRLRDGRIVGEDRPSRFRAPTQGTSLWQREG